MCFQFPCLKEIVAYSLVKINLRDFSSYLKQLLQFKEGQLFELLGVESNNIGMHSSIRKGVATYIRAHPGGPSSGSFSECVGWAVGRVKDIYIQYEQGGDMFVGRSLCGLPSMLPA